MSSEMQDLHDAVFGFRPSKQGTAYERLSAVVLATLGWQDVTHDTTESAPGKLSTHQLDVTGRRPSGEIQRLIVECKDWAQLVEQDTIDKLVGVRTQVGADAVAVITTKGYTAGAVAVASDEDITLVRLRAFDEENPEPYIKDIAIVVTAVASAYTDIGIEVSSDPLPAGMPAEIQATTSDQLLLVDESPAGTLLDVFEAQRATIDVVGAVEYHRHESFSDGRLLRVEGGQLVPIVGLTWTEKVHRSPRTTIVHGQGEPVLVLEELDKSGEVEFGRLVVDRELFAWDIDSAGSIRPRGSLAADV